jgi:LGFP repeat
VSAISDKYAALGGSGGFLGTPAGPESPTPDGVGAFQHYQFGSIYWTPTTAAHEVHGAIHEKWSALGWESFGYPSTDETGTPDGVGRFNHFHNIKNGGDSSIYWTPTTAAHEVHGAIHEKWSELGWENFGYPSTDETGTPDGVGRFNHFHNITNGGDSSIYWTPTTGAHEVHGAIRTEWAGLGWETGLGYPTTDEFQTPDLIWECSQFTRGSIIWSRIEWPTQSGAQPHRAGQPSSIEKKSALWGFLANPGYEGRPVKSVYFFAGNWKFGDRIFYEGIDTGSNAGLYTLHPSDPRHLGWSEQQANRDFALDTMVTAGVNVINLSYWGKPGADRWAFWAPMQCATEAHDEVFDTAVNFELLIVPSIETSAATNFNKDTGAPFECGTPPTVHVGDSPAYFFCDDFPGDPGDPAPGLVEQILDLVDRYLLSPRNSLWPSRWARLYDQAGEARHAIMIIQASSNQPGIDDTSFAAGLDRVAAAVCELRPGIKIGFMLDPLPVNAYQLTPAAGPALAAAQSFLAITPFISEISLGTDDLRALLPSKQQFVQAWLNAGVPFILDVSPGYDAHIVFPAADNRYWRIANNDIWHNGQTQMIVSNAGTNSVRGITFNTWNGYTEGYSAVPTLEYGGEAFTWLRSLLQLLP